MTEPAKPKRTKKHKDRPVYFVVRTMADMETGEVAGCLVPSSWADARILRERKVRTNDLIRATLHNPRNTKFHQLVHQLGTLVRENIEGYERLNSHQAIKRLQQEAGVYCETVAVDAKPVVESVLAAAQETMGRHAALVLATALSPVETVHIQSPRSIAYDCMDEQDFRQFWSGICQHLITRHWPTLTEEQITDMAKLMPENLEA